MTRLPVINFRDLDRVLRRFGFDEVRRKGSHVFYRNADGRTTTAPTTKAAILRGPFYAKFY